MGWGTAANVTTVHLDSATDDPSQARAELYNACVELQAVINGRNSANGVAGLDASALIPNTLLPNTIVSSAGNDLTLTPATGVVTLNNCLGLTPRTVSELQSLAAVSGLVAYCSDGDGGQECLAVCTGLSDSAGLSIWYRVSLGAEIST